MMQVEQSNNSDINQKNTIISTETLQDFLANASICLHIVDNKGIILWANQYELDLLGYSEEEYIGQHISKFHEDQHIINEILLLLLDGKKIVDYVAPLRCKDGHIEYVQINSSARRKNGEMFNTRCFSVVITEKIRIENECKALEKAFSENESRYQSLVNSRIGIFKCDAAGNNVYSNKVMLNMLGMTSEEAKGIGWTRALHPNDNKRVFEEWETARLNNEEFSSEYRLTPTEDKIIWVHTHIVSQVNDAEELIGYIGTVIDVTKRRQIEEQIKLHNQQIARISRSNRLGEMVSSIAHELNQPLTVISTYAQTCQQQITEKTPDLTFLGKGMGEIAYHAQRAGAILHRIKNIFSAEQLAKTKTNLNTMIKKMINDLYRSESYIKFIMDLSETLPSIYIDKIQIEQIIINIINNAKEAFLIGKTENPTITIKTAIDTNTVLLLITNNGPTISDSIMKNIFEPFFSTKSNGMGMGLSICRSIIEAHQGEISIKNTPPGDIQFYISLPITKYCKD